MLFEEHRRAWKAGHIRVWVRLASFPVAQWGAMEDYSYAKELADAHRIIDAPQDFKNRVKGKERRKRIRKRIREIRFQSMADSRNISGRRIGKVSLQKGEWCEMSNIPAMARQAWLIRMLCDAAKVEHLERFLPLYGKTITVQNTTKFDDAAPLGAIEPESEECKHIRRRYHSRPEDFINEVLLDDPVYQTGNYMGPLLKWFKTQDHPDFPLTREAYKGCTQCAAEEKAKKE